MIKFTVTEPQSLRNAIDNYAPELRPSEIVRIFRDKDAKVNGKREDAACMLRAGDEVVLYEKKGAVRTIYSTVYEDEHLLVADKESGVNSEGLQNYLNRSGKYRLVHRLDRNTAGLILLAKDDETERLFVEAIKARKLKKVYHAVCVGSFKNKHAVLRDWLIKDESKSLVSVVKTKRNGAREIITEYTVIEELDGLSLVEVVLHTGRTHQIRAHLASIGHPILGDTKYGNGEINRAYGYSRQLLLSKRTTVFGVMDYLEGTTFESSKNLMSTLKESK